jgi:hypothetical protein
VGAVDDGEDPPLGRGGDQPLDREDRGRRGGDVAHVQRPRAPGERRGDRLDDAVRGERKRHLDLAVAGAGRLARGPPGQVARTVLVVAAQDLVPRRETDRPGDDVDAGRRVGDEGQVVLARADVGGQLPACLGQGRLERAGQEPGGLPLELALPRLVRLEDRDRRRSERAVVEIADVGIEQEPGPERGGHSEIMTESSASSSDGQTFTTLVARVI